MKKPDLTNLIKLIGATLMLALLASGFIRAALFPKEINDYEGRAAYQLPKLNSAPADAPAYQDRIENALTDQFPFSQYLKKAYNVLKYDYLDLTAMPVVREHPDRYFFIQPSLMYNDMMVERPVPLEKISPDMDRVLASYDRLTFADPEAEFYLYYVESDNDLDFETGEKNGVFEHIMSTSKLPKEHIARFAVNSFADYRDSYYSTDHHWNWRGSYRGYTELLELLGCDEKPLEPVEEVSFSRPWQGSKSKTVGFGAVTEIFCAYRFEFPDMSVTIDGSPASDYGRQNEFFDNRDAAVSTLDFYGGNYEEVILDTGRPERESILLIGDSFTHAILKPLASHYDRTCLLDPRCRPLDMEEVSAFIEREGIDKVIFVNYSSTLSDTRFVIGGVTK